MEKYKISAEDARKICPNSIFKVQSTEQIKPQKELLGQDRVLDSINLAVNIHNKGYNIFAMGESGIGKQTIIHSLLSQYAIKQKTPHDWVYVNNFDNPNSVKGIKLKPFEGKIFSKQMEKLLNDVTNIMISIFDNPNYPNKIKTIQDSGMIKTQHKIDKLSQKALSLGLSLTKQENNFAIIPLNGQKLPLTESDISNLSDSQRQIIENNIRSIQVELEKIINAIPQIQKDIKNKVQILNMKLASKGINPIFKKLKKKWENNHHIQNYLHELYEYSIINYDIFLPNQAIKSTDQYQLFGMMQDKKLSVFDVNVIVNQSINMKNNEGAPIVILDNPNYARLFGKIEYTSSLGSLSTNIKLLKPGALHLANGGYLILNARKILEIPFLWESLKYTIKNKQIKFLSPEDGISNSISSLDPEPIAFNGKIILIGEPEIYYNLWEYDPEFKDLFKIVADFDSQVPFDEKNIQSYAGIISSIVMENKTKHIHIDGVCKLIEIAAALNSSQKYLTSNISKIKNIIIEANYIASIEHSKLIEISHINKSYRDQKNRKSKINDHMQKNINDKIIHIQTTGGEVSQINGLAVIGINDTMFGIPQRITSTVYKGNMGLINIEKNANMSGNIHSKGVFILQSFLYERFAKHKPFSMSASIVFEQSYGGVDGDSATCAETLTVISGLSGIPLNQSLAITGSMDQKGRVQAIGGVNQKIEGFFHICKNNGLNNNGVVIPKTNIRDLMLDDEIILAIKENKFNIYAIDHIDEAIEIFTNIKADEISQMIMEAWVNHK